MYKIAKFGRRMSNFARGTVACAACGDETNSLPVNVL